MADTALPDSIQHWGSTPRARAIRRALGSPVTVIGLLLVVFLVLLTLSSYVLPLEDPTAMDPIAQLKDPGTAGHPLGTDAFGRDLLSRTIHGAALSMYIALAVVAIGGVAGVALGVIAGYVGGIIDNILGRVWDVLLSFPDILLFIVVAGTLGASIQNTIIALSVGLVPAFSRLTRERVLAQRGRDYVDAARAVGVGPWRIMFKHVLPNSMTPVLVQAALTVPGLILSQAALSYLGLGVPPPTPSWGEMIAEGQSLLFLDPWISLIPGACILMATLGFNLLADGLRDYLDPTHVH
jgi:peptide/nickel transport system permease protein